MHSIVIARYNEDISWITQIPEDFEIFLYNKGTPITDEAVLAKAHHVIQRPNFGRESETYLHHMLNHRRDDDEFTVFAQGGPFDHSPDFLDLLANWRDWADLQPLTCQWKGQENVPPSLVLDTYRQYHPDTLRVRPERFSLMTWGPLEFIDTGALGTGLDYRRVHGNLADATNIAAHFLGLAEMDDLAREAAGHALGVFCYGAIFAVQNRRQLMLPSRNIEIMSFLAKGANCYGYVLERMWLHFFGAKFEAKTCPVVEFDRLPGLADTGAIAA